METQKFTYWLDEGMFLGYLEEYPDYMTQGETLDELKEALTEIYNDLNSGEIPAVRRVSELKVA